MWVRVYFVGVFVRVYGEGFGEKRVVVEVLRERVRASWGGGEIMARTSG